MSEYKLQRLPAVFALRQPEKPDVRVQQIGRGRFCTALRSLDDPDRVFLLVDEGRGDYSKRILADVDTNPYILTSTHLGEIGDRELYETRYCERLMAKHAHAWSQYRLLAKAREEAWSHIACNVKQNQSIVYLGANIMHDTIFRLATWQAAIPGNSLIDTELLSALEGIIDAAANYGSSYTFDDFKPRNLGVDASGHLVLLDPIFDLEPMERERIAVMKKARGY